MCGKWPGLDVTELIQNKIMNYCSRKRILLLFSDPTGSLAFTLLVSK